MPIARLSGISPPLEIARITYAISVMRMFRAAAGRAFFKVCGPSRNFLHAFFVQRNVTGSFHYFKIFNSVISLIFVLVMNDLIIANGASKMFLHQPSMVTHLRSAQRHADSVVATRLIKIRPWLPPRDRLASITAPALAEWRGTLFTLIHQSILAYSRAT